MAIHVTQSVVALAARDGDLRRLKQLLNAGEEIEGRMSGYTPLQLAILYGRTEAALELIRRGADIHATDPDGGEPLMLVAESNMISDWDAGRVARALLDHGATEGNVLAHAIETAKGRGKKVLIETLRDGLGETAEGHQPAGD